MVRNGIFGIALALAAGSAWAEAVGSSLRPQARPTVVRAEAAVEQMGTPTLIAMGTLRPKPRPTVVAGPAPEVEAASAEVAIGEVTEVVSLAAVVPPSILRPRPRPQDFAVAPAPRKRKGLAALFLASAVRTQPAPESIMPKTGSVCGDRAIRGEAIAPITSRVKGCGVPDAVRVTEVDGVTLSEAATIDCATATALRSWVRDSLQPAFVKNPVVRLQIAGHYVCRPRNNIRGNKISEHGRGKAIDISGFTLANGSTVTVARNWRNDYGKAIKAAYRGGCGIFGTTLGPGSDGNHEDHLHFDTAQHRSGSYCR